ncbi:MAG TPA: PaaI family thioesterase [Rhodospirillales bacterium]|nr:PaaI family thioesterase [Rhodospirillales bacterium]
MLTTIAALKQSRNVAALNDLIPYARSIGLEAMLDESGLLVALRFRESNIGNTQLRAIHGGVVGALIEHAAILHLLVETETAVVPKVINLSIDYLRPCLAADTFARGAVLKQGKRVANVRVLAWQDSFERPVAAGHAHFLLT